MAKIGNITIVNKSEAFNSGAAFLMQKPSPVSSVITLDSNSIVEVEKDNPYVVARTQGLNNYKNAFDYGHELVQKGLDILSITGQSDLGTRNATDENFVWWCSNNRITLRITDSGYSNLTLNATGFVGNGAVSVESTSIYPPYHKAYRYFRFSQITNNLFDEFRNMYLAFELLASSEAPLDTKIPTRKGTRKESESEWIKRYLTLKTQNTDILTSTFVGSSDPIQEFIDEIYKTARCYLFHAKDGESFFSPHSGIETHQAVAEALSKLRRIFLLLIKEGNQSTRSLGVGISTALEKAMLMTPFLDKFFFILSDDGSPFEPDEIGFDNPRYQRAIKSGKVTENVSNTHKFSLIGNIPNIESENLSQIRRVELADEDRSAKITSILEAPLCINEIDDLEIQFNQQIISGNSPNRQFQR